MYLLRLLINNKIKQFVQLIAVKRFPKGDQLIQNDAHGPHVRLKIVEGAVADFWRHVVRRAAHCLCHLVLVIGHGFRNAEVAELQYALLNENVLRLYVTVQDLLAVECEEG